MKHRRLRRSLSVRIAPEVVLTLVAVAQVAAQRPEMPVRAITVTIDDPFYCEPMPCVDRCCASLLLRRATARRIAIDEDEITRLYTEQYAKYLTP